MIKGEIFLIGLFCLFNVTTTKVIQTNSGDISGSKINVLGYDLYQYLGIPYAKPPLGILRFKPPEPISRWNGTYNATVMPPSCMQPDCPDVCSEDCLYLNIWVPENANNFSVMVYYYGGSFRSGSISLPVYNGSIISAIGGVILVTVNYRLGAFGFFCAGTDDARGNMGMKDQVLGLVWVKDNIEYFGGNTSSITIFGESAGSISVSTHLVSPMTKGLIKSAIMQSGCGYNSYLIVRNITLGKQRSQKLADSLGCTSVLTRDISDPEVMECMRSIDANRIVTADTVVELSILQNPFVSLWLSLWVPIYGDDYLTDNPIGDFRNGNLHVNEIMLGNDLDEGSRFLPLFSLLIFGNMDQITISYADAKIYIKNAFRALDNVDAEAVARYYLPYPPLVSVPPKMVYDSFGDAAFHCTDTYLAESSSANGKTVFFYMFAHFMSVKLYKTWMGVAHEMEVPCVFGVPLVDARYQDGERELSKKMIGYWTSFAKTGNPNNGMEEKEWPPYSSNNRVAIVLNVSSFTYTNPFKNACSELWEKYI